MATRQVDESEFLSSQAVINTLNGMLANPAARKLVLQARKIAEPGAAIPELDAAEPINTAVSEIRRELAVEREERAKERAEAAQQKQIEAFAKGWEQQKSRLRDAGWRDEGISEVEKHAHERGIPDMEIAAAHWEKLHPPSEPVQPNGSGSWGFFEQPAQDDTFVKSMIESKGDDESALNSEISAALKEFRGQTGARR